MKLVLELEKSNQVEGIYTSDLSNVGESAMNFDEKIKIL